MAESSFQTQLDQWQADAKQMQCNVRKIQEQASRARSVTTLSNQSDKEFSILSYNILADCFADSCHIVQEAKSKYQKLYFSHVRPEFLKWEHRWALIQRDIIMIDADIVCLQEVEFDFYEEVFAPFFASLGYAGCMQLDPNRMEKQDIANATFCRRAIFELVETSPRSRTLLNVLRHRQEDWTLGLANCHLQGDPKRRADRVNQVLNAWKSLASYHPDCVIVAGDFNDGVGTPPYTQLMDTCAAAISPNDYGELTCPWLMYDTLRNVTQPSLVTPGYTGRLDQVITSVNLDTTATLLPWLHRDADISTDMTPNAVCGSDHLPVGAILRFNPATRACISPPPKADPSVVDDDVKAAWIALLRTAPPKPSGRPGPEQMAALKAHAEEKKAFLARLPEVVAKVVKKIKA